MTDTARGLDGSGGGSREAARTGPALFRYDAGFGPDPGRYVPGPLARGIWGPDMVTGRVIGGLAVHALEAGSGDEEYVLSRLTVDLFRAIPFQPLSITTSLARKGGRIRVTDVHVCVDDELVARASAMYLRPSVDPEGRIWSPPRWASRPPTPPALPEPEAADASGRPNAIDFRPVDGQPYQPVDGQPPDRVIPARGQVWVRERYPLVAGFALTPLVRAALAADAASPVTNRSGAGLHHINTDFTLQLTRAPVGVFFGLETIEHQQSAGISVGLATLYDEAGVVGAVAVTALANPGRLTR